MNKNQITVVYGENPREMVETLLAKLKPEDSATAGSDDWVKTQFGLGQAGGIGGNDPSGDC